MPLDLVGDPRSHHLRDLGEVDAVVDDDVELQGEPVVRLADADAGIVLAHEQPERPAAVGLVDDAERLLDRASGDRGDGARRHGHSAELGLP